LLHVLCFRMPLEQLPAFTNPYHRVRMANAMLKSRMTRLLLQWRSFHPEDYVLGSGACRGCKKCAAADELPCRKPDRMIYSLEATGVDCGHLVKSCFGFELEWYTPGHPCANTLVMGGILSNHQRLPELQKYMPSHFNNV
jgi:predicted metal-binding protein